MFLSLISLLKPLIWYMQIKYMLFLRMIIGNQISTINVSFNKEKEGYEKTSLSNECAEVISTNHEKVKI